MRHSWGRNGRTKNETVDRAEVGKEVRVTTAMEEMRLWGHAVR